MDVETRDLEAERYRTNQTFRNPGPTPIEIIGTNCCPSRCNENITVSEIKNVRSRIQKGSDTATSFKNNMKSFLYPFMEETPDGVSRTLEPKLNGATVCMILLSLVLNVGIDRMQRWVSEGMCISNANGNTGAKRPSEATLKRVALSYLKIDQLGQPHPVSGRQMLPPGTKKRDFLNQIDGKRIPLTQFKKDTLLHCNDCVSLNDLVLKSSGVDKLAAEKARKDHWTYVNEERTFVAFLEEKSRSNPHEILLIKGDGMSKQGSKLPELPERPKHITDACMQPVEVFCWQVSCIPSKIYLQLDNASANKSEQIHGILGFLLAIVPNLHQITVLYSRVGHTHCSVDAYFGSLRRKISGLKIQTPNELANIAKTIGFSEVIADPTVYQLKSTMSSFFNRFTGRSTSYGFLFRRSDDGSIIFKPYATMSLSLESMRQNGLDSSEGFLVAIDNGNVNELLSLDVEISSPCLTQVSSAVDEILKHSTPWLDKSAISELQSLQNTHFSSNRIYSDVVASIKTNTITSLSNPLSTEMLSNDQIHELLQSRGYPTSRRHKPMKRIHSGRKRKASFSDSDEY